MKKIKVVISTVAVAAIAFSGLTSCEGNNQSSSQDSGEWYGVGFDVDANSRTSFLTGENITPSDFSFTGYENGDEVQVNPSEITMTPDTPLTEEDKQLTFKWKTYSTTLDISVSNTMVSECEQMENAPFKYNENEHLLNEKGTTPDTTSEDSKVNCPDARKAKKNAKNYSDGTKAGFLENVSLNSDFQLDYNAAQDGDELYIYANVASNVNDWGKLSDKYPTAIVGSKSLDLSSCIELSDNGVIAKTEPTSFIPKTTVTEQEMDDRSTYTNDLWRNVLYFTQQNFTRRWIGKVSLVTGKNNIKMRMAKKVGDTEYAYQDAACGNWDSIQVIYAKKGQQFTYNSFEVITQPKTDYLIGEHFTLDGSSFVANTEDGYTTEVPNDKITVSNTKPLTVTDTSVKLSYNGAEIDVPINVSSKITGNLGEDGSMITYNEPVHNRNSKNEEVGVDAADVDKTMPNKSRKQISNETYLENVSAYSSFDYVYDSPKAKGQMDIYATVASNRIDWCDITDMFPGAKSGFGGSYGIDFTKLITLSDNGKNYDVSSSAVLPATKLTKDYDMTILKDDITVSAWATCTYYLLKNFKRIHIGTVDIEEGKNNIKLALGYLGGGFGYAGSGCGNWESIEMIYKDEDTDMSVKSLVLETSPKTTYAFGEKFSLDGAVIRGYNKDGLDVGIIPNDSFTVTSGNGTLFENQTVTLSYQDLTLDIPITVANSITTTYPTLDAGPFSYKVQGSNDSAAIASIRAGDHKGEKYIEKAAAGSYFEYVINSDEDGLKVNIEAEICSNSYSYSDKAATWDGYKGQFSGSNDIDLAKTVNITNTVGENMDTYSLPEGTTLTGHVVTSDDKAVADQYFLSKEGKYDNWSFTTYISMEQFVKVSLGTVTLKKGKNTIHVNLMKSNGGNAFAYQNAACCNWKSLTITSAGK
jgi:hypothetical protein